MRTQGYSLDEITSKIFENACQDYNCRDNLSLVIVDLAKHLDKVRQQESPKNLMPRRNHSVVDMHTNTISPYIQNPFMIPAIMHGTPNAGFPAFMNQMSPMIADGTTNPKFMANYNHPCTSDLYAMPYP